MTPRREPPATLLADLPGDTRLALVRLFTLGPRTGVLAPRHLDPLRRALRAARLSHDGLRAAADDAVSLDPMMSLEALRMDVDRCGAALTEQLAAASDELDILAAALEEEAADAS
jgi:hypothetical protein